MIDDVLITPLNIIKITGGNVMHALKKIDDGFAGFGEAYFSEIGFNSVKAWKRHREMTLNLIVPMGEIRFVLFDDRININSNYQEVLISNNNYCRLTIPPMIWVGFQGLSKEGSMLLNIADILHDPFEVDRKDIDKIEFDWSIK
tara:strand:+ start:167 stop:598 length:432 start_codon:yes stop_codon:yes gene_type:complete